MVAVRYTPRRDLAEGLARRRDDHDRQAGIRGEFRARLVGQDGDGAPLARDRGVARAVAVRALDADVEVPG